MAAVTVTQHRVTLEIFPLKLNEVNGDKLCDELCDERESSHECKMQDNPNRLPEPVCTCHSINLKDVFVQYDICHFGSSLVVEKTDRYVLLLP